jgi:hypothetical protein
MTRLFAALVACLAVVALSHVAAAAAVELFGVRFPERVTLGDESLVMNGVGVRRVTILKVGVYVAGLYVRVPTASSREVLRADRPKYLVAVMKRDVSRSDTAPAFREGVERSAGPNAPAIRSEIAAFESWVPSMREGQQLTAAFTPGSGVVVSSTATREPFRGSEQFGTALFGMWLGPQAADAELRQALLKGSVP